MCTQNLDMIYIYIYVIINPFYIQSGIMHSNPLRQGRQTEALPGGERAWSLGEAYAPEALQAEEQDRLIGW